MSELQDKLDRGEITPQEYFDAWDAEMEEKERLHPGFHDRWYEYLMARYPGPGYGCRRFLRFRVTGSSAAVAGNREVTWKLRGYLRGRRRSVSRYSARQITRN
jgi:hypothetical protein